MQPYKIHVSDEILGDLHERLKRTRWPEKELVEDWSQGIPLGYVQEMCDYWLHTYNWRQRETELNRFDQFVTTIDECDIHFIHQRSPHEQATPLILSHGWPGSIVEFQKVIAPLSDPTN
ncbi:MAG: epoxide hydrolase N-terminal domain-containing protein, partial [Actinomycetota bacterium]|nr:epoxide hydrolase N-terminal domain-containing protein [Actinomycetota bacterium]